MEGRRQFLKKLIAGTSLGALNLSGFGWGQSAPDSVPWSPHELSGEALWEEVRKQYTFVSGQIYLNSATIGPMPLSVQEGVAKNFAKLAKGKYQVEKSPRKKVAEFVGADTSEISLTHNTTEGINIVATGIPLRRRDEVVITDQEHVGNALPWLNRARRDGIRLRVFSPGATAAETLQRISDLITRRTRVIAVPHITCTTGQVLPIKEIATLARQKGIWSFIDGAHGPGSTHLDLHATGCDFYAACGHKWLCGPPGTGILYVRKEKLDTLEAYMVGAYSETGWTLNSEEQSMGPLVPTAHRFDFGTQNNALHMGLQDAIEFLEKIGAEKVYQRGRDLAKYLQDKLLNFSHVEMLTPTEAASRGTIVGFKVKGRDLAYFRANRKVSPFRIRLVPESGLNSIRISTHLFNSYEQMDQFAEFIRGTA